MNDDLKVRFQELRAHERANVPPFDDLLAHAQRARMRRPHLAIGAAALAAAVAAILLWPRHMNHDVAPQSITQWRAPTDFLLQTPNRDLLTELPALDESVLNLDEI